VATFNQSKMGSGGAGLMNKSLDGGGAHVNGCGGDDAYGGGMNDTDAMSPSVNDRISSNHTDSEGATTATAVS
jgi:hypothetical protein